MVRVLSNFETEREKLLQIVLCGQSQDANDEIPHLVQLKAGGFRSSPDWRPLSPDDKARYIDHRARTAGYPFERPLFTEEALRLIAQYSEGVPRNINNLCFNALTLGYALRQATIGGDTIREAFNDLDWAVA